jgi:HD-GYP domain-containing protein (c-di-GMP phosphodiesterase class II)
VAYPNLDVGEEENAFFSIGEELSLINEILPYDLYINSSTLDNRQHFVRVFKCGEFLDEVTLKLFNQKYQRLYVREEQREAYLKAIIEKSNAEIKDKTELLKEATLIHLNKLFFPEKEFSTELLKTTIEGCAKSVELMVTLFEKFSLDKLHSLIGQMSFHDFYTFDHSINVSMYCIVFYREIFPESEQAQLLCAGMSGLLHDLGKIKIPSSVINQPGPLNTTQKFIMEKHPSIGKELLLESWPLGGLFDHTIIAKVIYEHHENVNGTGYPDGVTGDKTHILSKICAICDFFDAITTQRSYHKAITSIEALKIMKTSVDRKIDGKLFAKFESLILKEDSQLLNFPSSTNNLKPEQKILIVPDDFDPCRPHNLLPFPLDKMKKNETSPNAEEQSKEQSKEQQKEKSSQKLPSLKKSKNKMGRVIMEDKNKK